MPGDKTVLQQEVLDVLKMCGGRATTHSVATRCKCSMQAAHKRLEKLRKASYVRRYGACSHYGFMWEVI